MILQAAVNKWAAEQPETIACLDMLHKNGVRLAIFSSTLAHLAADSRGLAAGFLPKDTDIIMPKEDFDLAARLLGAKPKVKVLKIRTCDGLTLKMRVKEVVYKSDTDIQLMQPLTPLACKNCSYNTVFTPNAVNARQFYETEQGIVPLVHFADALFFYGILQRKQKNKNDSQKVSLLKSVADTDNTYTTKRANEMNIDTRVTDYLNNVQSHNFAAITK